MARPSGNLAVPGERGRRAHLLRHCRGEVTCALLVLRSDVLEEIETLFALLRDQLAKAFLAA